MEIKKVNSKQFRRKRKAEGYTQEQLGKLIGYGKRWIIEWEKGTEKIPITVQYFMSQLTRR